ncbi:MAG: hypothetical protein RBR43_06385 [Desulfuromonadaceae bacterium]|nr:hypothetical protein [Desulfuromonas sp.]MDY0185489.1 hypothetical protein [Desulfuromonadaceae bacterium]
MLKLFLPALAVFILAFAGLSIGIMFKRQGISGTCSSSAAAKLAGISCSCGRDDEGTSAECDNGFAVEVICPDEDPQAYAELMDQVKTRG